MIIQIKNRSHHVKYMQNSQRVSASLNLHKYYRIPIPITKPDPPPFIKQNYSKTPIKYRRKKKEKGKRSYLFMKWKFRLIFKIQIHVYCTYQLTKKKKPKQRFLTFNISFLPFCLKFITYMYMLHCILLFHIVHLQL